MKTFVRIAFFALSFTACESPTTSDAIQQKQQELILAEATAQVGMPAIKNFRERKLLKDILELRDQEGLLTYTYLFSEQTGKLFFFCNSIGYAIPYATQFTNPQKVEYVNRPNETGYTYVTLPQADPNGLFSPASAEGTWVLCKNPNGKDVRPTYVEPRMVVSPFRLEPADEAVPATPSHKP